MLTTGLLLSIAAVLLLHSTANPLDVLQQQLGIAFNSGSIQFAVDLLSEHCPVTGRNRSATLQRTEDTDPVLLRQTDVSCVPPLEPGQRAGRTW